MNKEVMYDGIYGSYFAYLPTTLRPSALMRPYVLLGQFEHTWEIPLGNMAGESFERGPIVPENMHRPNWGMLDLAKRTKDLRVELQDLMIERCNRSIRRIAQYRFSIASISPRIRRRILAPVSYLSISPHMNRTFIMYRTEVLFKKYGAVRSTP